MTAAPIRTRCERCKHWGPEMTEHHGVRMGMCDRMRHKYDYSPEEWLGAGSPPLMNCYEFDGYSFDTPAHFGCTLWEARE